MNSSVLLPIQLKLVLLFPDNGLIQRDTMVPFMLHSRNLIAQVGKGSDSSPGFLLALGADPEEIESVAQNLESGVPYQLLLQTAQALQLGIHDPSAADANQMRMGVRGFPIVSIAVVAEAQLQDLAHLLQQSDRLVHRRETRCGEILSHPLVDPVHTRVTLALGEDPQHRHSLRGDPSPPLSELPQHLIEPGTGFGHAIHHLSSLLAGVNAAGLFKRRTILQR